LVLLLGLIAWFNRKAPLLDSGTDEILIVLLMAVLSLGPIILWVVRGLNGVPAFELYCFGHFNYYVLPYIQGSPAFALYPTEVRMKAGLMVCLFLVCLQSVHFYFSRKLYRDSPVPAYFGRDISKGKGAAGVWFGLVTWTLFVVLAYFHILPNLERYFNFVRSIFVSLGTVSLLYLMVQAGSGKINRNQKSALWCVVAVLIFFVWAGGVLVQGAFIGLSAMAGYAIGSRKIPWIPLLLFVAAMNFLQIGKSEMRVKYWDPETGQGLKEASNPLDIFSFWLGAAYENLFGEEQLGEEKVRTDIFQRANLIHMVALVIDESPEKRPYLMGTTYAQIPILFVPRFLMQNKPRGSLPNETLCIYYGVQTAEQTDYTAIGFGRIAEAWANFGWLGIILLGAFYGTLLAFPTRFALNQPTNSVGFLFSALVIGLTLDHENALGTILVYSSQTMMFALPAFYVISGPPTPAETSVAPDAELGGPSSAPAPAP
jgi:hypothetical protein